MRDNIFPINKNGKYLVFYNLKDAMVLMNARYAF